MVSEWLFTQCLLLFSLVVLAFRVEAIVLSCYAGLRHFAYAQAHNVQRWFSHHGNAGYYCFFRARVLNGK